MQGRSWMAAVVLVAGLASIPLSKSVLLADDTQKSKSALSPASTKVAGAASETGKNADPAKPKGDLYSVRLELRIAGLNAEGCDIELKPAHRGCSFKTIKKHVTRTGELLVVVNDIKALNADRDCTFAITIKEPGHADRTERRGLRLARSNANAQSLPCFLSSPSKLARTEEAKTKG